MPVSKKRKKRKRSSLPPAKAAVAPKKKITKQQILIYIISGVMILSLAIGFIASGRSRVSRQPTPVPQGNNLLLETPAPGDDQSDQAEDNAAPEATEEN